MDEVPETDTFEDVHLDDEDKAGSIFNESITEDGGEGSSNFGHEGRPGKVGGSGGGNFSELSVNKILGREYTGYKGQDAIDKLMQEKQGYIKDLFNWKDIGDIALI